MALGTAEHKPNPQMPAPGAAAAPVEFDKDQPIDPVHLLRLYGDKAKSIEEMHAMALKDAAAVQAASEASVASKDVPAEEQMGEPGVTPTPTPAPAPAPRHPQQHDDAGRH